jgi:hypothetical protein
MWKQYTAAIGALACCLSLVSYASAGEVDVLKAEARRSNGGSYQFSVTLRHDDAGWDHYADRWQVVALDGTVLATRVLAHPHVDEQPFTRSLSGVDIPPSLTAVIIRGGDSEHGFGGVELRLELPN